MNSNGVLSFEERFIRFRPTEFPLDTPLIAPFWHDFNPASGGQISYRLTNDSDQLLLLHTLLLGLNVDNIIADDFYPEQIFVVTWNQVWPFGTYTGVSHSETKTYYTYT